MSGGHRCGPGLQPGDPQSRLLTSGPGRASACQFGVPRRPAEASGAMSGEAAGSDCRCTGSRKR